MLKALRSHKLKRGLINTCNCSSNSTTKSVTKTETDKSTKVSKIIPEKPYDVSAVTKEDMQWRKPWYKEEQQYYSTLRTFYTEDNQVSMLKVLQAPINLSPTAIKKWWKNKMLIKEIALQAYIPERNKILGNELAAAHFIVFRGGSVKFVGEDKWIKADKYKNYQLPSRYESSKVLEAIDCSDMEIHYEGLVNLRDLKSVKWLSLNGCEYIDDWCLDRISNIFRHSLVYLDLRNCPNITVNGLGALYKMKNLKLLYLDDFLSKTSYELTCLMLQELNPQLEVRSED